MDRESGGPTGYDNDRERRRDEVFERIPWETLEKSGRDPNRLVIAVAGAVVVGALAFSFTRNQPVAPPAAPPPQEAVVPSVPPATVQPPVLRSDADLYAVDHDRMLSHAAAHAEWFAVEYFSVDGSEVSRETLQSLLPEGVPPPQAPEGTQVYVDWAGTVAVTEMANLVYEVEVLVRSMSAEGSGGYVRQPPTVATIEVAIGGDGRPRVTRPPRVGTEAAATPHVMGLASVPESIEEELGEVYGSVVGGEQLTDGRWRVVVMATDPDGVTRPRTVVVP